MSIFKKQTYFKPFHYPQLLRYRAVIKKTPAGEKILATLSDGDFFGEMGAEILFHNMLDEAHIGRNAHLNDEIFSSIKGEKTNK